jgi:Bacterial extracellular solute-binding proteins, family 5 Middle.
MKKYLCCCALALFMFISCAKQVVKQPVITTTPSSQQTHKSITVNKKQNKDTLCYVMEFQDSSKRRQFADGIEHLLKSFPPEITSDSTKNKAVKIQIVKSEPVTSGSGPLLIADSTAIKHGSLNAVKTEPLSPVFGGTVKFYMQRGFIDQDIGTMLSPFPFDKKSCNEKDSSRCAGYLTINNVADKGISLSLAQTVLNAAGRSVSSFDLATGWTDFVRKHPAEARALFRYVNGIEQFISGHEAVITGFQIVDEKTVVLQLTQSDPYALQRLCTSRLLPSAFKLGPYFIKNEKNNALTLAPNAGYALGKPYLNACEIKSGKDANPFLSFSLHRYDIMTIFSLKDIDYASHMAPDKSNLSLFSADRYFLSLALSSIETRKFINRMIDKKDMLNNYVKAEGSFLKFIEEENVNGENPAPAAPSAKNTLAVASPASASISILLRNDDPISELIAEKLLADLSHAGLSCTMKSSSCEEYEKACIRRDYGIAIGWAPGSIVSDQSERLRLGTMWFNDEYKEQVRIDNVQEIPLFSIKTYLLCVKKIFFTENGLPGMFVKE